MTRTVQTQNWLMLQIQEALRKLEEGSVDLDVARAKHDYFKDAIRLCDVSLQTARIYKDQFDGDEYPLVFQPQRKK